MKNKGDDGKKKTVLDGSLRGIRRLAAIASTFGIIAGASALGGCSPAPDSASGEGDTSWSVAEENIPEDIVSLSDDTEKSTLVQGRDGCIEKLIENGSTREEATETCDEITKEAMEALRKEEAEKPATAASAASATQTKPQTVAAGTNTTTVVHDHSSNNMLLWYLLLNNNNRTPYAYYGNPTSGLTHLPTTRDRDHNTGVAGGGAAPAHFTPVQTTYLSTPATERPAMARSLASRPGVRVVPVATNAHGSTTHSYTSRGGMGGHGIGSGG